MKILKPVLLCSLILFIVTLTFLSMTFWLPIPIFGTGLEIGLVPIFISLPIAKRVLERMEFDWQLFARIVPTFLIVIFFLAFYLAFRLPGPEERNVKLINNYQGPLTIKTSRQAEDLIQNDIINNLKNSHFNSSSHTETRVRINRSQVDWVLWNRTGLKFKRYVIDAKTGQMK